MITWTETELRAHVQTPAFRRLAARVQAEILAEVEAGKPLPSFDEIAGRLGLPLKFVLDSFATAWFRETGDLIRPLGKVS